MTNPDIPQRAPIVFVSFSAEVNPTTTETLISIMAACISKEVQEVYLLLSTPGGSVMNGVNLYNFLLGVPFGLTIHNVSNVDSIGNAIFLAGKTRYSVEFGTFMFHGVGFDIKKDARLEEKLLRESLDGIRSDQTRIGQIIAKHTRLTPPEIEALFFEAQTKDARYAIDKGIIDEIRDIQIPLGSPIITPVFQR